MSPTVRERLGLDPPAMPPRRGELDRGLMARALMFLLLAGAAITFLSLLIDGTGEGADRTRMAVMATGALSMSVVLFAGYDGLPRWVFPLFLACGTLLIEWTIYASGEPASPYAMFWFWLAIYAFYFFPRWLACSQLGFIALAYAAVLSLADDPGSAPIVRWAVTTSALIVAGAMIGMLKERLDRVIAELYEVSRADTETGLLNARAFSEILERALVLARRTSGRVALVVGHLEDSDDVIGAAAALSEVARSGDTPARIAERTFAVIAPGTGDHGAYVLAERAQQAVPEGTMSFGVASFPDHAGDGDELMAAAQAALAEARELGRGRVVTSGARPAASA